MPSQKPELPPLKTPKSFTFPSEIQDDPKSCCIDIKREDSGDSSIPTPDAYKKFLEALSPAYASPLSSDGSHSRFMFDKEVPLQASQPCSATTPAFSSGATLKSPAFSLPPVSPCTTKSPKSPHALRRLRIPHAIKTSLKDLPRTATPLSATPRSATILRSPFSPSTWKMRYFETPRSATPRSATSAKAVSVRQVVTRTVTYKRTPLEPPPKGKRRRTQDCKES
ncbi:hypothetical protein N7539_006556 [Penicillium diatomitis]|uniref:Uncharacterized protein n=1 Tax=Penicillium diatomitis TaxID=2819901 RepID=A0A9W9X1Y3_9EURO|nr:uncharacterized protein N7539_006556 [Penicillium diatomitis]KAJ5480662.1 hypothetical protein N7539_006556 [Penicillium diatomitis]